MSLTEPDFYTENMECPECGEDVFYDRRFARDAECEHCHWTAADLEPDVDDTRGDEWDAPIPADWP